MFGGFHAVVPKKDCPHCTEDNIAPNSHFEGSNVFDPCKYCSHEGENWLCLKPGCKTVACSRYVKSHMVQNHQSEVPELEHPIVFSFADFSYWCYACDSYVEHPLLKQAAFFTEQKFGLNATQAEMLKKIKESEHKEELKEEDEDAEDSDEKPSGAQKQEEVKEEQKEEQKID